MVTKNKPSLFSRLAKTREFLSEGLSNAVSKGGAIDIGVYEEIEDQLILSDLGTEVSREVVDRLRKKSKGVRDLTGVKLREELQNDVANILRARDSSKFLLARDSTSVVLVVGVNGVGKTTTVAKLAYRIKSNGQSVMLAACDTFRAAAIEQLEVWGERLEIPVVSQKRGTDAAAVAHDAFSSARSRGIDTLIVDTAGRQHVNADLMEQLRKIRRVLNRVDDTSPHDTILVVDAGNGQNVLAQTRAFDEAVSVTGICVTKLDGTARGGIVVALAKEFDIPIPFIGTGEGLDDLEKFDAVKFAEALLPKND